MGKRKHAHHIEPDTENAVMTAEKPTELQNELAEDGFYRPEKPDTTEIETTIADRDAQVDSAIAQIESGEAEEDHDYADTPFVTPIDRVMTEDELLNGLAGLLHVAPPTIDTSDLPPELVEQLRFGGSGKRGRKTKVNPLLAAVMDAGKPVTINEVLILVWRATGKTYKRSSASATLSKLVATGEISDVSRGVYAAIDWQTCKLQSPVTGL